MARREGLRVFGDLSTLVFWHSEATTKWYLSAELQGGLIGPDLATCESLLGLVEIRLEPLTMGMY